MSESVGCIIHGGAKDNSLEFEGIRNEAGRNSFPLSAKEWIELTHAQGLNEIVIRQMQTLIAQPGIRRLGPPPEGNP